MAKLILGWNLIIVGLIELLLLAVSAVAVYKATVGLASAGRFWVFTGAVFFAVAILADVGNLLFNLDIPHIALWLSLLIGSVILLVSISLIVRQTDRRIKHYSSLIKSVELSNIIISKQVIVAVNDTFMDRSNNADKLMGGNPWDIWGDTALKKLSYEQLLKKLEHSPRVHHFSEFLNAEGKSAAIDLKISTIDYGAEEFLITISDAAPRIKSRRKNEENALRLIRAQEIANLGYWNVHITSEGSKLSAMGMEEIFGVEGNAAESWWSLVHPADIAATRELITRAIEEGVEPDEYTYRIIRPDGEVRHLRGQIGIIKNAAGEVSQVIGVIQDITDIIRSEERLRHAQKMEAVGELTGGLSHDFNNLLHVILGNVELIESESEEDVESKNAIRRAAERGSELTQRLLAFSRKQILDPRVVNANDCVAQMLPLLRRTLGETIKLESRLAEDLHNCNIDPGQLENSVLNLAINAQHSMPMGGSLIIETKNVSLDDAYVQHQDDVNAGPYVLISIADSGGGMPEQILDRVFEPFFTTKEVGKGSGLGLSMVYGFIKQSGGHVEIESEIDVGTTVKLYLPFSNDGLAVQAQPAQVEVTRFRGKVLLVEDDAEVAILTTKFLKSVGYTVFASRDAKEALVILKTVNDFVLLLTDVVLPGGINGPNLAKQVCIKIPDIKVMFMSGYTEDAIVHHGIVDEGVILLHKPFRKSEMIEKLQQVFA